MAWYQEKCFKLLYVQPYVDKENYTLLLISLKKTNLNIIYIHILYHEFSQ